MPRKIQDALLTITTALPTADGTVTTADFDLGIKPGDLENYELEITVPALTATQLPDADTLTITVQSGAAAAPTALFISLPVITGSTGYAGGVFPLRLSSPVSQFVNVKVVAAGGTGDISASDITTKLLF